MVATFTVDGTPVTTARSGEVEFTQVADHGNPGNGRIRIDDAAGTLSIVGQKDFTATESDCATPETFDGFMAIRDYMRGQERTGTAREIDAQLEDLNTMLGFRGLTGSTAKRPAETVGERLEYLLGSDAVAGLFSDNGRVTYSTQDMDKADYRQQYPGDVLADCVLAAQDFNYYIRNFGAGPELVFRNDNTSTADTSDVRISNVIADVNGDATGLTFYPQKDAVLTRDPGPVKSKLRYNHAKGGVTEELASTAATFNGERYGTASNSNVKTDEKASRQALRMLQRLSTEEDAIECTIQVPSSAVNLVAHGDRIQVKFTHLTPEGYGSFTWVRVLEATKRPLLPAAELYDIRLKLTPQEPALPEPPATPCSEDATPSGTYYPLGLGSGTPTGGFPNVSDGVVYYFRSQLNLPQTPEPGWQGAWHFPNYGAGGLGTIDYAGSCTQNRLYFMTVGNGTWTIQTEAGGTARGLSVYKGPYGLFHETLVASISPGDSVEVVIDDAVEGDCVRFVEITDETGVCGSYWGWSEAVWVAAP